MALFVPRIMIATYGSEQNGLVVSISQIITMFLVVEAGLSNAAMVSLYKPLAHRADSVVRSLMAGIERLYRPVALVFGLLVVVLAFAYPKFISVSLLSSVEVSLLIMVLGVNGVADFLFYAKYRVLLNASQRSYIVSRASVAYVLLNGLIIASAAWGGFTILQAYSCAIFAIFCKLFLLRSGGKNVIDLKGPTDQESISRISNRGDVLFQQILGSVQVGAPALLATFFTSLSEVSVLSMYLIVALGLISIVSIVCSAATAGFGHLYANRNLNSLRHAYFDLEFVFSFGVGVVFGVCFFLITPFINLYANGLDDVNYQDPFLGILVCLNGWLYAVKAPGGMMVMASGHFRETRYRVLIQGLILVVLGTLLAPFYGLYGIMLASILSNLYRVLDLIFYVPSRILEVRPLRSVSRTLNSLLLLIILGLWGTLQVPVITSWVAFIEWALMGIMGGIICAVVLSLLFERKALRSLWRRVAQR